MSTATPPYLVSSSHSTSTYSATSNIISEPFRRPSHSNLLKDQNVQYYEPLISPELLLHRLPPTPASYDTVESAREHARHIIARCGAASDRLLIIVGPCSIHDVDAAREYALQLQSAIQRNDWQSDLLVVMRAYLEKPRTTVGWKGLLYDPTIDSSNRINHGLEIARQMLLDITAIGVPVACEVLDTISPQYMADLYSWGAVGARTTESQIHRQLVSGLSFPIGFKNSSSGSVDVALDAIKSAESPHCFMGITSNGLATIVHTAGNANLQVIHRGGDRSTNYDSDSIAETVRKYPKTRQPSIMVDASHGNSEKDFRKQAKVIESVAKQIECGQWAITGVMIESNINEGKQSVPAKGRNPTDLKYGVSITDGCVGLPETLDMLARLSRAVRKRRTTAKHPSCSEQDTCTFAGNCPKTNW